MKPKKQIKKKLPKISTLNNKLFAKWSLVVRERAGHQCEYCGIKKGEINKNGKVTKIDAHHLQNRKTKNSPLKFDPFNGVAVCPVCHKFGEDSFHRCAPSTMHWLLVNKPERYFYIIENLKFKIDLANRKVLEEIEKQLETLEHLDLDKLKEIEATFPRIVKTQKSEIEGTLFDKESDEDDDEESETL